MLGDESDVLCPSLKVTVKQKVLQFCFSKALDGTGTGAQWGLGRALTDPRTFTISTPAIFIS